ncbi:MAG TPA: hypothetical protein VJN64_04970 [Terriglobales bacterium]|nr:hypothetical protein [Terriglobales bacterium]
MAAILTGQERQFWIHPELVGACLHMLRWQNETGSVLTFQFVYGTTPVDAARNKAVETFLASDAEWLLQIDNDVVPSLILNVFQDIGDRKIVAFPYPLAWFGGDIVFALATVRGGHTYELHRGMKQGWSEVDVAGTGCFMVHRDVFLALDQPWFTCTPQCFHKGLYSGEDFNFCEKAKAKGFQTWTHSGFPCKHFRTVDLMQMMQLLPDAITKYWTALSEHIGQRAPTSLDLGVDFFNKGEPSK